MARNFKDFKTAIQEHEVETNSKYVYNFGRHSFSLKEVNFTQGSRLHWEDRIPFFLLGSRSYVCRQGKDNTLDRTTSYVPEGAEKAQKHQRSVKQLNRSTAKLDCPAAFTVNRLYWMPNYEIPILSKHNKNTTTAMIKAKLKASEPLLGEIVYRIQFPRMSDHRNHDMVGDEAEAVPATCVDETEDDEEWSTNPQLEVYSQFESSDENPLPQSYEEPQPSYDRKQNVLECNILTRSLGSIAWLLQDEYLETYRQKLQDLFEEATIYLREDEFSSLPTKLVENVSSSRDRTGGSSKSYGQLKKSKRKGYSCRAGETDTLRALSTNRCSDSTPNK